MARRLLGVSRLATINLEHEIDVLMLDATASAHCAWDQGNDQVCRRTGATLASDM